LSTQLSKLPPQVQERLLRLQQLQQALQSVLVQKQQVEGELTEIEQALNELQKTSGKTTIYKMIGSLLLKTEKPKVTSDLKERKDLLKMRTQVLAKQEERMRNQLKSLQEKLQSDLKIISPS
jgi:prefoldin beta subunit